MATLFITEYSEVPAIRGVPMPVAVEPAVANQAVSFTTSAASSAFNAATRYVRVIADADCHLEFGSAPTATATDQFLPANQEAWRIVTPGLKVAAYDGSS